MGRTGASDDIRCTKDFDEVANGSYFLWVSYGFLIPYHLWDWNIYLHEWLIFMVNVGKYTIHGWVWVSYGFLKHTQSINSTNV